MLRVQLDDDLVGLLAECGRRADRGGQHDAAARRDVGCFHHGPVHGTQEAVAHGLRQHRQVHVEEARLAGVDALAQDGVGLVRRAETDRLGLGQRAIQR